VYEHLAPTFQLTDSERDELLPSGSQRRWHNRANWACYDLYRAGLLKQIKKGVYEITEEGKALAAKKPPMIDREFLMQFEPFRQFMSERKARNLQPPVSHRFNNRRRDDAGRTHRKCV
jgi:restriction system protein